jgi:hypothetical protein
MDVCLLCIYVVLSCVGRGLCDGLITRPEESYRVSVCVITETPKGALCSSWEPTGKWMSQYWYSLLSRVISCQFIDINWHPLNILASHVSSIRRCRLDP